MKETDEEKVTLKKFLLGNFAFIAGLLMALFNIYLTTKLAPMAQDIKSLDIRVEALGNEVENKIDSKEFELVNDRLDRIQTSLNDLIKLHLK